MRRCAPPSRRFQRKLQKYSKPRDACPRPAVRLELRWKRRFVPARSRTVRKDSTRGRGVRISFRPEGNRQKKRQRPPWFRTLLGTTTAEDIPADQPASRKAGRQRRRKHEGIRMKSPEYLSPLESPQLSSTILIIPSLTAIKPRRENGGWPTRRGCSPCRILPNLADGKGLYASGSGKGRSSGGTPSCRPQQSDGLGCGARIS